MSLVKDVCHIPAGNTARDSCTYVISYTWSFMIVFFPPFSHLYSPRVLVAGTILIVWGSTHASQHLPTCHEEIQFLLLLLCIGVQYDSADAAEMTMNSPRKRQEQTGVREGAFRVAEIRWRRVLFSSRCWGMKAGPRIGDLSCERGGLTAAALIRQTQF